MFSRRRQGWLLTGLCGVLLLVGSLPSTAQQFGNVACKKTLVNQKGTNKADIVIGVTAVTIADANRNRCELVILNTGFADVRCLSSLDGDPTGTAGFLVYSGLGIVLQFEGTHAWKCIRDAAATEDSTVSIAEVVP